RYQNAAHYSPDRHGEIRLRGNGNTIARNRCYIVGRMLLCRPEYKLSRHLLLAGDTGALRTSAVRGPGGAPAILRTNDRGRAVPDVGGSFSPCPPCDRHTGAR